ncbi:MAG: Mth938-like domain-containing protein [Shimia sp.]
MRMNDVDFQGAAPVEGYGAGFFRLGGVVHEGPLLTVPTGPEPWAGLDDHAALTGLAGRIDVLLLGLGAEVAHPPATLRAALEAVGIGVEPMATPSACRTYNVLLGEGRRIGLAALPV